MRKKLLSTLVAALLLAVCAPAGAQPAQRGPEMAKAKIKPDKDKKEKEKADKEKKAKDKKTKDDKGKSGDKGKSDDDHGKSGEDHGKSGEDHGKSDDDHGKSDDDHGKADAEGDEKHNGTNAGGDNAPDKAKQRADEESKHLKRLAKIQRLAELGSKKKDTTLVDKCKMLRDKENARHDRAMKRLDAADEPKKDGEDTEEEGGE